MIFIILYSLSNTERNYKIYTSQTSIDTQNKLSIKKNPSHCGNRLHSKIIFTQIIQDYIQSARPLRSYDDVKLQNVNISKRHFQYGGYILKYFRTLGENQFLI